MSACSACALADRGLAAGVGGVASTSTSTAAVVSSLVAAVSASSALLGVAGCDPHCTFIGEGAVEPELGESVEGREVLKPLVRHMGALVEVEEGERGEHA